ncbi:hypothetical protein [Terricaulis sp.]|uniref:hypothetical protein n=1 Tax=Terricaulis sp. TaxID=2768686 RepID=UPI003784C461
MRHIIGAALAAAALSWPVTVSAQEQQQPAPFAWHQVAITGGCLITIPIGEPVPDGVTLTWDQTCTPGQTLSGQGTVRLQTQDGRAATLAGAWIDGVPNGAVVLTAFDPSGVQVGQRTSEYNMGCVVGRATCTPYQVR